MKANELLFWLSARCQGSWQQFRAAVEELHSAENESQPDGTAVTDNDGFPLHQQLRLDLERLAHVKFFSRGCESDWGVAPPTLAAHRLRGGVRAVMCGARSPRCASGWFPPQRNFAVKHSIRTAYHKYFVLLLPTRRSLQRQPNKLAFISSMTPHLQYFRTSHQWHRHQNVTLNRSCSLGPTGTSTNSTQSGFR